MIMVESAWSRPRWWCRWCEDRCDTWARRLRQCRGFLHGPRGLTLGCTCMMSARDLYKTVCSGFTAGSRRATTAAGTAAMRAMRARENHIISKWVLTLFWNNSGILCCWILGFLTRLLYFSKNSFFFITKKQTSLFQLCFRYPMDWYSAPSPHGQTWQIYRMAKAAENSFLCGLLIDQ